MPRELCQLGAHRGAGRNGVAELIREGTGEDALGGKG